eukprot:644544-Hanusia_phi.AAC.1
MSIKKFCDVYREAKRKLPGFLLFPLPPLPPRSACSSPTFLPLPPRPPTAHHRSSSSPRPTLMTEEQAGAGEREAVPAVSHLAGKLTARLVCILTSQRDYRATRQ